MTDLETTTCPECTSEQPFSAPFCQNCGFRLREAQTVREVLGPSQREKLGEYLQRGDKNIESKTTEEVAPVASRPARRMVAVSQEQANGAPSDRSAERSAQRPVPASSTLVEGVRAVSPKTVAMPAIDFGGVEKESEGEQKSVADASAESTPPPKRIGAGRAVVFSTIIACVAIVIGLTLIYQSNRANAAAAPEEVVVEAPVIIDIEEGVFRRGLSDEAQSFILQYCYRYHENPSEDCDRERLLTGEFPQQTVRMPAYQIDSGAVRNMDYQECVTHGACEPVAYDECDLWTPRGLQIGVRMPRVLQREERPVICVNREEAQTYCQWRGGDLPTNNQWEKAARGRNGRLFPWGDHWQSDLANWGERDVMQTSVAGQLDGFAWTSPPGAFPDGQSPMGVDDMAGNVAEWVRGDDELVGYVRGGSWISNPFELRTTARVERNVDTRRTDIGFRCVY